MKKNYIQPQAIFLTMDCETLMATSIGVTDGAGLGNKTPDVDTDDNFFSREQGTGGSYEFWED